MTCSLHGSRVGACLHVLARVTSSVRGTNASSVAAGFGAAALGAAAGAGDVALAGADAWAALCVCV